MNKEVVEEWAEKIRTNLGDLEPDELRDELNWLVREVIGDPEFVGNTFKATWNQEETAITEVGEHEDEAQYGLYVSTAELLQLALLITESDFNHHMRKAEMCPFCDEGPFVRLVTHVSKMHRDRKEEYANGTTDDLHS